MLNRTAKDVAARLGFHVGRRRNHDLIERDFYSPVPNLDELPPDIFERENPLYGIKLDSDAHLAFVEANLAEFFGELEQASDRFEFDNIFYAAGDAHIAYAMVRHLKPARMVELGSGYSTRVMALACAQNAAGGAEVDYRAFDPYAYDDLHPTVPELRELQRLKAQEIPDSVFTQLGAGDVLFVDTSHTVKLGGDVNRIVLEVLPQLAAGVHVHFHDIWLPFEYHPGLVRDKQLFWAEQYLLQAFLAMNPSYAVTIATRALCARHPKRLRELVPRWKTDLYPSSFWIRRL